MINKLLEDLNEKQIQAVSYSDGPSVILAGAGSGKTRVLVYKVLHLINDCAVDPRSIIMITFTNKAALEMKERIFKNLNRGVGSLGFIGTFHSFCCYILRRDGEQLGIDRNFVIYDENDQSNLIKSIIKKLDIKKYKPPYFLNRISYAKNQLIGPKRYLELFNDYGAEMVVEVYQQYQKDLKKNKALDFDDLIMETVNLLKKNKEILHKYQERFRYIFIDEFQDTNHSQYFLTKLLGEKYQNLTVVGDFSQSIYSWRGADIKNLEKFREDFSEAKIFNLEQNYRSTQTILDFAYKVISKNQMHPILELYTSNGKGEEIDIYQAENEEEEALYVATQIENLSLPHDSFAVLYRTNAQSRAIEEVFLHFSIPYVLIGGTRFYERKEVKDVLSYLRLFINPNDEMAKDRIKKLGQRRWDRFKSYYQSSLEKAKKIATVDLMEEIFANTGYLELYDADDEEDYERIENIKELKSVAMNFPNLTEFLEQVALVESEYSEGEKKNKNKDGVRLMTLHQAKGLEFPVVFIVGAEEGILPHSRSVDDLSSLEEERRLFYVGITRAKQKLFITYTNNRFIFGRSGPSMKSRFLEDEAEQF